MLRTVIFDSGHRLTDNGAGGYDFHCPSRGNQGAKNADWVWGSLLDRFECPACGLAVGMPTEGEPYQETSPERFVRGDFGGELDSLVLHSGAPEIVQAGHKPDCSGFVCRLSIHPPRYYVQKGTCTCGVDP